MEKKKIIGAIMVFVICTGNMLAQKDSVPKTGMLRAQANISGGYLFSQKKYAPYISANIDYYINNNFSITSEAWVSFDIINMENIGLRKNYSLFLGLNYHPVKFSRWDPYIGFSAGGGIHTVNYFQDTLIRESPIQFTPLVGVTAGCNYYIGSVFHFFVQAKFVAGGSNSSQYGRTYLEEIKFSGGLGWNFTPRIKKKKQG
jgi:hypothetical protein